jgi:hypothetical protein
MNKTRETALEENRHKYYLIEQDNFHQILSYLVRQNDPNNEDYEKYYNYRNLLIALLEDNHRWRFTSSGLVNRSDFRFNPHEKAIVYKTNKIKKSHNGYYVDDTSTREAIDYFEYNKKVFQELARVEKVLNYYYLLYREELDRTIALTKEGRKSMKRIDPSIRENTKLQICTSPIHHTENFVLGEIKEIYRFLGLYQKDGLKRLLRWLNALNGEKDLDTLYTEYLEEMGPFAFIPEKEDFLDGHKMAIANYLPRLLKMIKKYSVRGEAFYQIHKQHEESLSSPKLN